MPLSIDLHVKCPFYKKWNKKKTPIFFSWNFYTVFREQIAIFYQIFKSGSSKIFFKCPQYTKVGLLPDSCKCQYLSNASTVCDGIFTIHSQDNIDYYHFWIIFKLIPIQKNLPPNLNKGFIEPPCIWHFGWHVKMSSRHLSYILLFWKVGPLL